MLVRFLRGVLDGLVGLDRSDRICDDRKPTYSGPCPQPPAKGTLALSVRLQTVPWARFRLSSARMRPSFVR